MLRTLTTILIAASLLAAAEPPPVEIYTPAYEAGSGLLTYAVTVNNPPARATLTSSGRIENVKWGRGPCTVDGAAWLCDASTGGLIVYAYPPADPCVPFMSLTVTLDSGATLTHTLRVASARTCGTLHTVYIPLAVR